MREREASEREGRWQRERVKEGESEIERWMERG